MAKELKGSEDDSDVIVRAADLTQRKETTIDGDLQAFRRRLELVLVKVPLIS